MQELNRAGEIICDVLVDYKRFNDQWLILISFFIADNITMKLLPVLLSVTLLRIIVFF